MFEPYILYLSSKIVNPNNKSKQVGKFLRSVYGVGFYRSHKFIVLLGVNKNLNIRISKLSLRSLRRVQAFSIKSGYALGNYLRRRRIAVRKFLIKLKLRRGLRQFYGLPSRGQRSHSNRANARKRLSLGNAPESKKSRRF
jgi:ribosomal protein S13